MTDDLQADLDSAVENIEQEDLGSGSSDDASSKAYDSNTVSKIVKREQQKAYERGKREALMELQQQQEQQQPAQAAVPMQQPQQQSLGGMPQMSEDDIRRIISEQTPQFLQEQAQQFKNQQTVDSFVNKMRAAEERYPGIEERLNDLNFDSLAPVVQMANDMENTADIMNELLENPMKMGNLVTLMYTQPRLAQKAMFDLSNSIKQNQEAMQEMNQSREPLSQLKPSSKAGIDNSKMTVSDFRKMFKG